jgi:DNA-binding SARP family transcriptional activator
MRFGILGRVLVDDGAVAVAVPAARQRVLLAALLVHAGQAVSAEALAEVVWDGSPPPAAAGTLRTHVMRLRRVLGPRAGKRLVTRYPGYLVEADGDEIDLLRFSRMCRDGSAAVAAGSWQQASQIPAEALGLWRGPALADVPSQLLQRNEVPRIDQLRLQAQEWRIDADLHLGRHTELVPELQSLAAEYPLRERFHAHLLLALYRSGRQAEALAAYRQARGALVEELGAEPGPELQQLHQQILTADPALSISGLPASPGTLVLVTSRSQLGGLAAADGAQLLTLDLLTHAEAVHMLAARLGAAWAAAEPAAVERIASLCAHLPLALAVAAARAAARPRFPLAAELAGTDGRLDALDAGDLGSNVRAVFSWSTRQLTGEAARMFRLLGIHPGADICVPAAAKPRRNR